MRDTLTYFPLNLSPPHECDPPDADHSHSSTNPLHTPHSPDLNKRGFLLLLARPLARQPEEKLGWVKSLRYHTVKSHPLCPRKFSHKQSRTKVSDNNTPIGDKRPIRFDCSHCPNHCICLSELDSEGNVLLKCDCAIAEGLCVNSLEYVN